MRGMKMDSRKRVGRREVIERLWELARVSPKETRNTIGAQVRAAKLLAGLVGDADDERSGRRDEVGYVVSRGR